MKDYKIWNYDFGKVFIERYNKEIGVDIEKEAQLGPGGQAIDTMLNGLINKDFDDMIKAKKANKNKILKVAFACPLCKKDHQLPIKEATKHLKSCRG